MNFAWQLPKYIFISIFIIIISITFYIATIKSAYNQISPEIDSIEQTITQDKEELLKRGIPKKNIIYINLESLRYERLKEYHALYEEITNCVEQTDGRVYILLDEIQEVHGWEQAINSLRVDFDCDIYITGSNAKLLSGELATLLAGRYVEISNIYTS